MEFAKALLETITESSKSEFSKEEVLDLLTEISDVQEINADLLAKKKEFFSSDVKRLINNLYSIDSKFKELSAVNDVLREKTKKKQHNGDRIAKNYILKVVNKANENNTRISLEICELFQILLGNCHQCPFSNYDDYDDCIGCIHGAFSTKEIDSINSIKEPSSCKS